MYDFLLEIAHSVWKNGISISALGTALYVLLKQRKVKRALRRLIPWLLQDESETKEYVANQARIEAKLDVVLAALGVELALPTTANAVISNPSRRRSAWILAHAFTLCWAAKSSARSALRGAAMLFINSNIQGRNKKMKKWFRPDALTVIVGVLAAAAARYTGIDIDPANILGAAILLAGYFKAHEFVTVVRDANGLPTAFKWNSRKLIFTLIAFGLVVADIALQLNLGNELILAITAAVTGFNYAEAKKDAKEAEHEASEGDQTH